MNKRILILSALALTLLMVLCGCSGGTNFPTDLGTFKVIHATTMDTYSTMNAQTGQTLLVVRMTMDLGFDETRFKNYFAAEDESSVAKATIGGGEYNCTAVAYQGLAKRGQEVGVRIGLRRCKIRDGGYDGIPAGRPESATGLHQTVRTIIQPFQ